MRKAAYWIVAILSSGAFANSFATEAQYANLFGSGKASFSIDSTHVYLFDRAYGLKTCSGKKVFVCVTSEVFVFAVPRGFTEISQWELDGATYQVLGKRSMELFGRRLEYVLIRQVWQGGEVVFAYSEAYGVISMQSKDGQLMLRGRCGFAAKSPDGHCLSP
jgi:hypothetical protein